jgi:hypothetical protein
VKALQPSLFLGTTPAPARGVLQKIFEKGRATYPRVVVPCAGRFSGPLMAIRAGYKPAQIEASDISLFSSLIGFLVQGKDPRELGATISVPEIPALETLSVTTADPATYVATVLMAQKLGSQPARNAFQKMVVDDLHRRWEAHVAEIRDGLVKLVTLLKGIRYEVADVFAVVEAASEDDQAILYVDPPGFARGYEKMFGGGGHLTYTPPAIAQFDPRSGFPKLRAILDTAPALTLMLRANTALGEDRQGAVWAMPAGARLKYLWTNRPDEVREMLGGVKLTMKPSKWPAPGYPVWGSPTDTLTADSRIDFVKVSREVGLYYRDMFAHTLGSTDSEIFFLMLIDKKVFSVVGFHARNAFLGVSYPGSEGKVFLWESFGFSTRHRTLRHLNRILMMCISCEEFRDLIGGMYQFPFGKPDGIRTACITKFCESKGNRGILKLISREKRPDGRFHLVYQASWRPGGFQDQLKLWLTKYGSQAKAKAGAAAEE